MWLGLGFEKKIRGGLWGVAERWGASRRKERGVLGSAGRGQQAVGREGEGKEGVVEVALVRWVAGR
ncbi:hypothetical protein CsSME_00037563 [Camellia sinensis var. sinensis]